MLKDRTYDYTKEHKEIDHTPEKGVYCTWCGKQLDPRKHLEDYALFMGSVWAHSELPCKPYVAPTGKDGKR
jgi:hypothetical protein